MLVNDVGEQFLSSPRYSPSSLQAEVYSRETGARSEQGRVKSFVQTPFLDKKELPCTTLLVSIMSTIESKPFLSGISNPISFIF